MNVTLDVKCNITKNKYKRLFFSDDIKNGVVGIIGEKILSINIEISNSKKDINNAIELLKTYRDLI